MIDELLVLKSKLRPDKQNNSYKASDAVVKFDVINPQSTKLAIIFPGWHGSDLKIYDKLQTKLINDGYAILRFEFHENILEANVERVKRSFETVSKVVSKEVNYLHKIHSYQEIHLIGLSLGNTSLAISAGKLDWFSHATFVVGGSNMAATLFEGTRTWSLKKTFDKIGVTKTDLIKSWEKIAPGYYASSFAGKDVRLYISKTDRIIPSIYQEEFKLQLKRAGASVTNVYSKSGHAMSIIRFCSSKKF